MPSVLETLKLQWAASPELVRLIPAERVFLGPPNPGTKLLCLGLLSERIAHAGRSNRNRVQEITVEAAAQAQTVEELEHVRDAVETELAAWQSDRYGALCLHRCELVVSRSAQSPSTLWLGELTLVWETMHI